MVEAMDLCVTSDLFTHHVGEWEYALEFWKKHGETIPADVLERRFPEFEVTEIDNPLTHLVEELRNLRMHRVASAALKESATLLKEKKPAEAIEALRKSVLEAESANRPAQDINLTADPMSRVKLYDDLKDSGGMLGLPFPWEALNVATQGVQDTDFGLIEAKSGVGKSWCEVILAKWFWAQGHTPLLFTKEMGVDQIARRFDAAHANLEYQRFRSGELTQLEYEAWIEKLEGMKDNGNFWVSGDDEGMMGVAGMEAKIDRYNPSVVLIDGVSFLDDDRGGKSGWEKLLNISYDLKKLARRKKVPIIASHWFNKNASGEEGTADDLAYSDVQKAFDWILGMYQTEELRGEKEMLFKLLKQREGEQCSFVTNWDLTDMEFTEKSEDDVPDEEDTTVDF